MKKAADEYNRIAAVAAKAGMQQGLHNEGFEMSEVDGRRTYDMLLGLLDPEAGEVPVPDVDDHRGFVAAEYFRSIPGRFISMHLQDVDMNAAAAAGDAAAPANAAAARPRRAACRCGTGQHRLGEDVPGREDRRRQELLRRAEHGADAGERRRS